MLLSSTVPAPVGANAFADSIATAVSAAPDAISGEATVLYVDPAGTILQLRRGTNGWWCVPPTQAPIGPRVPLCGDAVALDWLMAWMNHEEPTPGATGVIYALAGGRDASAIDPFRMRPAGDQPWIETGPHVMLVNPPADILALHPAQARPDSTAPYVMWPDTPFAHLRLPMR